MAESENNIQIEDTVELPGIQAPKPEQKPVEYDDYNEAAQDEPLDDIPIPPSSSPMQVPDFVKMLKGQKKVVIDSPERQMLLLNLQILHLKPSWGRHLTSFEPEYKRRNKMTLEELDELMKKCKIALGMGGFSTKLGLGIIGGLWVVEQAACKTMKMRAEGLASTVSANPEFDDIVTELSLEYAPMYASLPPTVRLMTLCGQTAIMLHCMRTEAKPAEPKPDQ